MFGAILGGLASGLLGALGEDEANDDRAAEAQLNRDFQERMANTAYQRAMEDMRKAGLNPMLAYSQGGAAVPQGSVAQVSNKWASAANAFNQVSSGISSGVSSEASGVQAEASMSQAMTANKLADNTVRKTVAEIENMTSDTQRLNAVVDNLRVEYSNLIKEGWNKTEVGNQLRAIVSKLQAETWTVNTEGFLNQARTRLAQAETALTNLDVSAASRTDNFGRTLGQFRPLIDILRTLLGRPSVTINRK